MKRLSLKLRDKARKIKLLLLDVDGVLTDGGIFIDDRGCESKRFDVRDGQGIVLLRRAGVEVGFITGRSSNVVRHRARELGVTLVYQNVRDKAEIYHRIKSEARLHDEQIAYAGDDIADLAILSKVGLAFAVRDAALDITPAVDYVTAAQGGRGAVREISELLLNAQERWKDAANHRRRD